MGFLDLSTSASAKKHVDLSDARYQLVDRLKYNENKSIRPSFTLYDNKGVDKMSTQDISTAYELSDKRLPIGELLNKLVDLIIDVEDGLLNTEKDAIYAWKYSNTILAIYEDKIKTKRRGTLLSFDNGMKNSIINSQIFANKYPGKYTSRTNFYDEKIKDNLIQDVIDIFKNETLKKIHELAILQSQEVAKRHINPTLDKIVQWAADNYKCKVESYFDIKTDEETMLSFSVNTIILHLKNGYDLSVVGFVGTDHDDKFAVSIFNAGDASVKNYEERIEQSDIKNRLMEVSEFDPVTPLYKMAEIEKQKRDILQKQYDILSDIRPMIKESVLSLKAAESVVGQDYIWGCMKYRKNHNDLPDDFKLEDVKLPALPKSNDEGESGQIINTENINDVSINNTQINQENNIKQNGSCINDSNIDDDKKDDAPIEELFKILDENKPLPPKKVFGDTDNNIPILNAIGEPKKINKDKEEKYDSSSILLPGMIINESEPEVNAKPITKNAEPAPIINKGEEQIKKDNNESLQDMSSITNEDVVTPELVIDDLDSLFAK